MVSRILLVAAFFATLVHAQHNVVLTWNDNICTATNTTNCNPPGVTYNVYRAPGPCPASGAAPSTSTVPFSTIVNVAASTYVGGISLNYTDMGVISPGQSFCYYATVVNGYIVNAVTGLVVVNESAPSNYSLASLAVTGSMPLAPLNVKAMLQ